MKTSVATVSIAGTLEEKLVAISAAGFDGIEIFEQDFITHDGSPRDVGQMVRDHGLEIQLFQPFRDFEGLPEPLRSKAFDRAERKFDLMEELGTDLVLICSSVHPKAVGGIDRAAADLHELGERAARRGLRVGYEALAWGKYINDHRDAWEIVRRANHPNVGLILDSFHTLGRGISPESIRSIPGDRIFFIQLADAPRIDMDLLYWSRHFRNMPGEGDLPVVDFMRAVAATGYAGPISLEIFNDQFRGGDAKVIARDGHRSLIALMDDVRRAEPTADVDLPPFPPRIIVNGIAFIEFTSRGKDARAFEQILHTLGFTRTAVHRNKTVSLWEQGEIRVIVNEELEGHAAEAWDARGTSVCDIGLRVTSAADVFARARALGVEEFPSVPGPGELDIPAIRGLSGSLLHFIDSESGLEQVWEVEFQSVEDTTNASLVAFDHIAQTMSYEAMLSWTLFYTSLFHLDKSAIVDVTDPDGLVRSQVVEAADGPLRITLNGADSYRTLAGRMLAETFGSPMQHIAFATVDIFATLAALAKRGFEALPIPGNYYEDLAARFDLQPDLLDRMRAAGVLYDHDGGGAFFQVYSKTFAGGLFFEIVQRDPGYKGFGAPNAPFRIAAQKRIWRGTKSPALVAAQNDLPPA